MRTLKTSTLAIGAGVLALLVILGFTLLAIYGGGTVQRKTADFRGKTGVIEKTRGNSDFRIAAYNEFFELCGSVQAQEDRIVIFTAKVKRSSGDALANAQTDLDAVTAERAQLIREYNEKATRADTEGHFRASNLPYQIDITKEHTECAS